jgi:hypothetical protein
MGDELYEDPIEENERVADWRATYDEWVGYQNSVRPEAAWNAAILIREYPTASPDLVAGVSAVGYNWSDPTINEMIKRDSEEQGFWGRNIGRFTRPVIGTMWSLFDQAISRNFRVGARMWQGEGFLEAVDNSGQSIAANVVSRTRAGEENVSAFGETGLLPRPAESPLMQQGAGERVLGYMEQGATPEQAKGYYESWAAENYAPTGFQSSMHTAESTMLHYQDDEGVTRSYHATPGRMGIGVAMPFVEPETAPWRFLTGTADITLQVGGDPMNPAFRLMTRAARARRTAIASERYMSTPEAADDIANGFGGVKIDEAGRAEGAAFHGGAADAQSGIVTGGYTDDLAEASRHAGSAEEGVVYHF